MREDVSMTGKHFLCKRDFSGFMEPAVELVRCTLRMATCNFALSSKRDASKASVMQFWSFVGALSSVLGAFLDAR